MADYHATLRTVSEMVTVFLGRSDLAISRLFTAVLVMDQDGWVNPANDLLGVLQSHAPQYLKIATLVVLVEYYQKHEPDCNEVSSCSAVLRAVVREDQAELVRLSEEESNPFALAIVGSQGQQATS